MRYDDDMSNPIEPNFDVQAFLSYTAVQAVKNDLPLTLQTAADALCQMSDDFLAENVLDIAVDELDRTAFDANFKAVLEYHGPNQAL